ncbi:MAG TPA: hypothetical protein VFG89_09830 [Coriobacteriia bacterium]|nr:hypothetical protein [Coriobacteriia bacterium]
MRRIRSALLVASLMALFVVHAGVAFGGIIVEGPTNLTPLTVGDSNSAQTSGDLVVWHGDSGGNFDILVWSPSLGSPLNISNTPASHEHWPQVSGERVVWQQDDGAYGEIFTWKVGDLAPTNLSNTALGYETMPQVDGDRVVWQGNNDIFFWEQGLGAPINITNTPLLEDGDPQISGDFVVWSSGPEDGRRDIYVWAVGSPSTFNLSNSAGVNDVTPQISGLFAVWSGSDGSDSDVYICDVEGAPTDISNNAEWDDIEPQISGDRVAWECGDGEVYSWSFSDPTPVNISQDEQRDDIDPQVSGDRVVWSGFDGVDSEIFTWRDGDSAPVNLSNQASADVVPQIFGGRVVWSTDADVFTMLLDTTSPSLTPPGDITTHATSPAGASVHFGATASDGGGIKSLKYYVGSTEITSPHTFPVGMTDVRCAAIDEAGNESSGEFSVVVVPDTTIVAAGPTRITHNGDGRDDMNAQIFGDRLVWWSPSPVGVGGDEIQTWRVGDLLPTTLAVDARSPQISGDRVVWSGYAGSDEEIYTWKVGDASPTNISNHDGRRDSAPQISGDRVVWSGYDGNDDEIYTWKVGDPSPTNISNHDGISDDFAYVDGDRIVWQADDGVNNSEIYTWAVGDASRTNISNNPVRQDSGARVSGDRVVWFGYDGNDYEIFTWKAGDATPTNISNHDGRDDFSPNVHGDRVVWSGNDGNSREIYTWAVGDTTPTNISDNDAGDDGGAEIFGDWVVWTGSDGNDTEIYAWRVGSAAKFNISNHNGRDDLGPQISGSRVVWQGDDGNDSEIYTALLDSTPPSLSVPADATVHASSRAGVSHPFAGVATDPAGVRSLKYYVGPSEITSPYTFGLGRTQVRCVAVDELGFSREASFKVTVVLDTALGVAAPLVAPAYGTSASLVATLASVSGEALAGETVILEQLNGSAWTGVGTGVTDAAGKTALATPALAAQQTYRVRYAGAASSVASVSDGVVVSPKVKLARSTSWKTRSRNTYYTAKGFITPKHVVSDANKVRIIVYKKAKNGRYQLVKSYKAKYATYSKTKSRYSAKLKFTSKGSWAIRAYHPKDATHAATYGSWDYFKVR